MIGTLLIFNLDKPLYKASRHSSGSCIVDEPGTALLTSLLYAKVGKREHNCRHYFVTLLSYIICAFNNL